VPTVGGAAAASGFPTEAVARGAETFVAAGTMLLAPGAVCGADNSWGTGRGEERGGLVAGAAAVDAETCAARLNMLLTL
jgi:hypothetical protein